MPGRSLVFIYFRTRTVALRGLMLSACCLRFPVRPPSPTLTWRTSPCVPSAARRRRKMNNTTVSISQHHISSLSDDGLLSNLIFKKYCSNEWLKPHMCAKLRATSKMMGCVKNLSNDMFWLSLMHKKCYTVFGYKFNRQTFVALLFGSVLITVNSIQFVRNLHHWKAQSILHPISKFRICLIKLLLIQKLLWS